MSFTLKTTKTLFFHTDFILEFMNNEQLEIEKDYLLMIKDIATNIYNKTGQTIVPHINLGYRIEDQKKIDKYFKDNDLSTPSDLDCLENILTISASSLDNNENDIEAWKLAVILFCEEVYSSFKEECDIFSIKLKQNGFSVNFRYMDTYFSIWKD